LLVDWIASILACTNAKRSVTALSIFKGNTSEELNFMLLSILKGSGIVGSILAILALVIVLLKTIIAFIAFLTGAIKILIIVVFVAILVIVGLLVLRGLYDRRRSKE
jgi:hypothetical protein